MIAIMKKNYQRLMKRKTILIVFVIMLVGALSFVMFTQNHKQASYNIAFRGDESTVFSSDINVTYVDEELPLSDLVSNKYDAYVSEDFEITSIKSESFQELLKMSLTQEQVGSEKEDVGLVIIKMITMFLFMQANYMMFTLGDDFEHHLADRILKTPLGSLKYLLSNILFTVLCSTVITMLIISLFKIFGFNLGYSLLTYLVLISLINMLASSISSCFYIFFKKSDTSSMFSQIFVIMSSLLSGSFNIIENKDGLLANLSRVLPQKIIYTLAESSSLLNMNFMYVMIWISITILISHRLIKRTYH